jgi:hypothetical protein
MFREVYGGFLLGRVGAIKEKLKALKIQVGSAGNFIQIKRIIGENRKIRSQVKKLNSIFEG